MNDVTITKIPFPCAFGLIIDQAGVQLELFGCLIINIYCKGVDVSIILSDITYGPKLGR